MDPLVHWDGISYFRDSVFDVDVADMQHVDRLESGLLHGLDGLEE